jgi:hypothetical protein
VFAAVAGPDTKATLQVDCRQIQVGRGINEMVKQGAQMIADTPTLRAGIYQFALAHVYLE